MQAESPTQAFLFADLAGFTALTEAHGDAKATELAEAFADRVRALLPGYGGELIKTIGDEVMVRVESPDRAVELGLEIVEELARPGMPPVRVGIHCGPAVPSHGDWYGSTVNVASRVNGVARTGEVLLTEYARRCLEGNGFTIEARGKRYFKHIVEPIPIYRAVGPGGGGRHLEIDPVCRMAVDPHAPSGTRHRRGETFYFCSAECERAFEADPRRYIATSPGARIARRGFSLNLGAFLAVAAFHVIDWATGSPPQDGGFPAVFVIGAVWAFLLAVHYRAVRRIL